MLDRTSHFYNAPNNHTWTQYLVTLPPIVRRYYNTLPPSRYDYPHLANPKTTRLGGYSKSTDPASLKTIPRKRQRTTPQPVTVTPKDTAGTTNPTTRSA